MTLCYDMSFSHNANNSSSLRDHSITPLRNVIMESSAWLAFALGLGSFKPLRVDEMEERSIYPQCRGGTVGSR